MFKTGDIVSIITDAIDEYDGLVSDKTNEDGTNDIYFTGVDKINSETIRAYFTTWIKGDHNTSITDEYEITVRKI